MVEDLVTRTYDIAICGRINLTKGWASRHEAARRGVLLPTAVAQDFGNGAYRSVYFLVAVVKVRRDPNPGLWAVIHQHIPSD